MIWLSALIQFFTVGLPSALELLRVVINILDPHDQLHTDSTRLIALRILTVILEVSGPVIPSYPSLSSLILDHGCKYLFQLARADNNAILQAALRAVATMFEGMKKDLKLQQELFLTFTIDRLSPPPSLKAQQPTKNAVAQRPGTPSTHSPHLTAVDAGDPARGPSTPRLIVAPARGDTRELLLETLVHISRHPSFMVDLYVNYDCDMNCENMFERLIEFATKVG